MNGVTMFDESELTDTLARCIITLLADLAPDYGLRCIIGQFYCCPDPSALLTPVMMNQDRCFATVLYSTA